MKRRLEWIQLGTVVLLLIAPRMTLAREVAESSKMKIPMLRSGSDDDVTGTVDFRSSKGKSRFRLRIKKGPPSHELEIIVNGVNRGSVTTSAGGSASVQFQSAPVSRKSRLLDFDPRGKIVEIQDVGDDKLLTNETGDDSHPPGSSLDERANLTATGVQPAASGHALLRERKGRLNFNVEVEDVTDGVYDLIVEGVVRGTITVLAGRGEIEFANPTDDIAKLPLDFDPLGKLIQIAQGSSIILTGSLLAPAPGVNVCTPAETASVFSNVGPDPDASGDARLRIGDDCRRDFRVEAEDLPVGPYELVVAGTVRGTINVAVQPDASVQGEIEFSSDPDDPDELPLNFDPTGAIIEVRQGATVFLSTTAGTPGPGTCDVIDSEVAMVNSGADADAKGKARVRQDVDCGRNFRVEIEKLPIGDYELVVGGITRGTINVQLANGEAVGHIEFDTEPDQPGELLLDFDPRGQFVEVGQGATVFLSVTAPN
jgi:hypothetical protein